MSDLPFILLFDAESWEAKVTAYCVGPHKVNLAICAKISVSKRILVDQKDKKVILDSVVLMREIKISSVYSA